jgi:nickel-dependent lactate racemase
MREIFTLTVIACLFSCKPKGTAAKTSTPTTEPNETMVTAAKAKFTNLTLEDLKKGHAIYYSSCTRCHGAKKITKWNEKEWVGILDNMAQKAKLTSAEKDATWKYIMAVRLSATKD